MTESRRSSGNVRGVGYSITRLRHAPALRRNFRRIAVTAVVLLLAWSVWPTLYRIDPAPAIAAQRGALLMRTNRITGNVQVHTTASGWRDWQSRPARRTTTSAPAPSVQPVVQAQPTFAELERRYGVTVDSPPALDPLDELRAHAERSRDPLAALKRHAEESGAFGDLRAAEAIRSATAPSRIMGGYTQPDSTP